jgi:hypothetical protein
MKDVPNDFPFWEFCVLMFMASIGALVIAMVFGYVAWEAYKLIFW